MIVILQNGGSSLFKLLPPFFIWRKNMKQNFRKHNHGNGSSIDLYAYSSDIRHWNPAFKVIFSMIILILCIVLNNPYISVAIIIAMSFTTVVKGGLSIASYICVMTIPIVFIILGTIAIGIDISFNPIGQYNLNLGFAYVYTSSAKLKEMFYLILKVFASISALQMMTLSTPSSEIINVLRKMRVPKLVIELMHIIYRYIFILIDIYSKMRSSAKSRQGYCDFKTSCYTFGNIVSNMLVLSLNKANIYYDAMEARCYDGELNFLEEDKKIDKIHLIVAAVFIVFLILLWSFTK